jgi:nitroimidazol reductase NimA-like FMN-containing flavoprotein (pyridoxamine 5'-phosphate oxidase superfamily)
MTITRGAQRAVEQLDERECWSRLLQAQAGRLAFEADDRIAIVPLNLVVQGHDLVFRTTADAELLREQRLPVSFEIDGWDGTGVWSVVAQGTLRTEGVLDESVPEPSRRLAPWAPDQAAPRTTLVALAVSGVTGRRFTRRRWQDARWYW